MQISAGLRRIFGTLTARALHSTALRLGRYALPHRKKVSLAAIYCILNKIFDLLPAAIIPLEFDQYVLSGRLD